MEEMSQSNVCLVLLCGVPASGKTTLAHRLQDFVSEKNAFNSGRLCVLTLHYDHLIPTDLERQLILQTAEQGGSHWKLTRNQITSCVSCLLNRLTSRTRLVLGTSNLPNDSGVDQRQQCVSRDASSDMQHDHFTVQDCHQQNLSRRTPLGCESAADCNEQNLLCLEQPPSVDSALWERFVTTVDHCVRRYLPTEKAQLSNNEEMLWLVLVDDNLHYSSMRYEYCQLSRKYGSGLCTLCLTCPLEEALRRNASRTEGQVESQVIVHMQERLEPPDSRKRPWEKYSIVVDGASHVHLDGILQMILCAMQDPQHCQLEEDVEGKTVSRFMCSTNTIHQADQILRRCVSFHMAKAKETSKEEMKRIAAVLTRVRTNILDEMKRGERTLPFDPEDTGVRDASKNSDSPLFQFVQQLFEARISDT